MRYKVDNRVEPKKMVMKTIQLGGKIMVNAVVNEEVFTVELKVADFILSSGDFLSKYKAAVDVLNLGEDNNFLSEFVSRAALTQLFTQLQEKVLSPVFGVVCPEEMQATSGGSTTLEEEPRAPRPSPLLVVPPVERNPPVLIPQRVDPFDYGRGDLQPNIGPMAPLGGNWLGPGHPALGPPRGQLPPPGHPPGARWDPIGPGRGDRPRPRSGRNSRGRGTGDDFPPPSFNGGGF